MRNSASHFRHVVRRLRRAPMFTGVTLLTLAVGIGANTAIFSVIDGVLLKALPYYQPDRLVGVWHTAPGLNIPLLNASPTTYFTYREESRTFEDVALWDDGAAVVTGQGAPERVDALYVTYTMFPVLRARPAAGRIFNAGDDLPKAPDTVVISYGYWQRRFGGDPAAIGRRIIVDGRAHTVIGVLRQDFRFLDLQPELFFPLQFDRAKVFVGNFSYQGIARLKPGATMAQANADVARMIPMTMDKFPLPPGFTRKMFEDTRMGPKVRPLKEDVVGDIGKVLWVLMGTVGIVLLIACANVANLFLVRAEGRQREFAVRSALGAGWGRIARELLGESVGLALAGGALGVGFAYAGIRLLVYLAPSNLPRLGDIAIDGTALLFTLGISILAGVLFGLIPVFRYAGANLVGALKEGGRALSGGKEHHRTRNALVVSQVALALILLIGSGLMMRTLQALKNVDPGFVRPADVQTFRISVPEAAAEKADQVARAHYAILDRIRQIPGVESASAASSITMDGSRSADPIFFEQFPTPEGQIPPIRRYKYLVPGYLSTMGTPLLAGRDIAWDDIFNMRPVVLISQNFAREHWKNPADALGQRVRNAPQAPWRTIVGVVADIRDDGVSEKAPTVVYWPLIVNDLWEKGPQVRRQLAYAVRTPRAGTAPLIAEIREAVRAVNPDLAVTSIRTLQRIYERSMARTSFTLVMLGIASAMALLLGLVGIYGVISYSVSQRTREIGIRMALGAEHREVRRLFVRHGLLLTAVGIAVGLGAALALTRVMSSLLFGVSAMDPLTYAAVAAALAAAALLASYLPARRATVVDPARALRAE